MRYNDIYIKGLGYELPSVVISSRELEKRLTPFYEKHKIPFGQLEALTGIRERRWWSDDCSLAHKATLAARKALSQSGVPIEELSALVYAGVSRDYYEPATACEVAYNLGIRSNAMVYDISNACLGVLNGMIDIAGRITLGEIRAGMIVSAESARAINEETIARLLQEKDLEFFKHSITTLTGGSGAAAVILTDGSFGTHQTPRLLGNVAKCDMSGFDLCRWGVKKNASGHYEQFAKTDSVAVFKKGIPLMMDTFHSLLDHLAWSSDTPFKIISHQVGKNHRETFIKSLSLQESVDFPTFGFLGNMGSVSLPISLALAHERGFLTRGDHVALIGMGSGINSIMMGVQW